MKRMTGILLSLLLILSGCGGPAQPGETAQPQMESDPSQVKVEPLALADKLSLRPSQEVELYDYEETLLLLGIYDKEKVDPSGNAINDAGYPYLEKFLLFDVEKQTIHKEFPVEQFTFCLSAVIAFDGVLSALAISSGPDVNGCAFYHSDAQGTKKVIEGGFTPFDNHLQLFPMEGGVVYHFDNPYETKENHIFGVKRITPDWQEETLLTFEETEAECLWVDVKACQEQYAFMVKQDGRTSFYRGSATEEPVRFLTLPTEVEVLSFDVMPDALLILQRTESGESGYYLELFDWEGNGLDRYRVEEPCWSLTANANHQFCGVPEQVILKNTPVLLFEATDQIRPVPVGASSIDSNWNSLVSNGKDFLIYSLNVGHPQVWRLTFPEQ